MSTKKSYLVTHGTKPAAIDESSDLDGALALACSLILDGKPNVAIQDGTGKQISGNELVDCCSGKKKLTADLRAI